MDRLVEPSDQYGERIRPLPEQGLHVAGAALTSPACQPTVWPDSAGASSWTLPWTPRAVGQARRAVRADLRAASLPCVLVETAELLVSELVGNALRHAVGPLGLALMQADVVLCSVGDGSRVLPQMHCASLDDEWGRGLALVEELSGRWGSYPTEDGKITWFELYP